MDPRRVLLIRRRRPLGEPSDQTAGAWRMLEALARGGVDLARPSVELTTWLLPADLGSMDVEAGPPGRFDAVVLGSHLVNTPDEPLRAGLLHAAARRAAPAGRVFVEHHPLDWATTAAESWSERDGRRLGMVEVRPDPPFVSAVSVYEVGDAVVRQPFTARVLSDAELAAELARAGLVVHRRLSPTWLEAARAERPPHVRRFATVAS